MPTGVFQPYSGVKTSVIIFTKTGNGGTDNVWFYDMTADGYSLDAKRTPINENDIPDIISRYNNLSAEENRKRTEKSFFVTVNEIKANGYDLSINKYKETEKTEKVYRKTSELFKELSDVQNEMLQHIEELKRMLGDE